MSMTRQEIYDEALDLADALDAGTTAHPRYERTVRAKRLLGLIHMEEWKAILNRHPFYQVGDRTVAVDATGLVALSALDSGAGDARQHTHRIIAAKVGDIVCWDASLRDYPFAHAEGVIESLLIVHGRSLELPSGRGGSAVVKVNYFPCRADLLSADDVAVDFPDGYEMLLAYRLGSRLVGKGAEELTAAAYYAAEADEIRTLMLADIGRVTINPIQVRANDTPADWGVGL